MITRRDALYLPLLLAVPALSHAETSAVVVGMYPLAKMRAIAHLTFPRVLLYDGKGALIDKQHWPKAMSVIGASAGDAFCCVSEDPAPADSTGPPPDCKRIVYGEDIDEHFQGLIGKDNRPLRRTGLPPHNYLIVEYYASWCSPCVASRKALEAFMASSGSRGYASLVVDFSALQG